jgi:hypothetical protein
VNVHGQMVFSANLSTGGEAVFLYSQGALMRVVGPGDATPDDSNFVSASSATINATGQVTFQGATSTGDLGVYLYSNGTIATVAHAGTPIGSQKTLAAAFQPSVNSSGQISFTAALPDGTSAVLIASPTNGPSTPTPTLAGPLAGIGALSPEQARAIFERATHTGVFANPDTNLPENSPRL